MTSEKLYAYLNSTERVHDEDEDRMLLQAEHVASLLGYCARYPGATIKISVESDDGQKAKAVLYDQAAFTGSLMQALEDFQEDIVPYDFEPPTK